MEKSSEEELGLKLQRKIPKNVQIQENVSQEPKYDALQYALFLCYGNLTPDFESLIQSLSSKSPADGGAHIRVVLMNLDAGIFLEDRNRTFAVLNEYWAIDMRDISMLSSQLVYHSQTVNNAGETYLEICYNISEYLSYDEDNILSLESSLTLNVSKPGDMRLSHEYEPLYFRYNPVTGQTTYVLPNATLENRSLLNSIGQYLSKSAPEMHPFTMHTVILSQTLAARSKEIDDLYRRLLWIEHQIYQGSIFQDTNSERFTRYIQLSHKLSRNLITLEHRTQRDGSHIDRLLRDLDCLWKLENVYHSNKSKDSYIDSSIHERIRDCFLCLKESALDRERQIINLQRKTQIFVTLLYHLITGHDSAINLRIASETANVSHEAKKDSTSMKIIAGVTMFYLPATFVCSLFGTNFVALDTNGPSDPNFVVSKFWWVYLAFAIPLTGLTFCCFWFWRRWRGGHLLPVEGEKYTV
ncbi:hypothetical protein PISL3812_03359 [Talaromyces islandicus]|uniref:Uncharacterized protein n=1 Tax=Talaromyces islandicus TaxID=28573 RepID=A0A0U1LSK0_TALIS|nr:hypothetical protein PISL3812_03359 [Talaromyces islandicus]